MLTKVFTALAVGAGITSVAAEAPAGKFNAYWVSFLHRYGLQQSGSENANSLHSSRANTAMKLLLIDSGTDVTREPISSLCPLSTSLPRTATATLAPTLALTAPLRPILPRMARRPLS